MNKTEHTRQKAVLDLRVAHKKQFTREKNKGGL